MAILIIAPITVLSVYFYHDQNIHALCLLPNPCVKAQSSFKSYSPFAIHPKSRCLFVFFCFRPIVAQRKFHTNTRSANPLVNASSNGFQANLESGAREGRVTCYFSEQRKSQSQRERYILMLPGRWSCVPVLLLEKPVKRTIGLFRNWPKRG